MKKLSDFDVFSALLKAERYVQRLYRLFETGTERYAYLMVEVEAFANKLRRLKNERD